ncbi:Protein nud1 [Vermiconidia calcicola]|uniref:Protein nud1 n=1 Tax=Vermiconidia calcicola TaxID=1690605 RepID=A0ACC3NR11_9PEZI|nr:Protein nud1 [Vermiconidia calcicola]
MTTKVAPWLQGLSSDGWEAPQRTVSNNSISSASHDAKSLRNSSSRVPKRSLSGLPSSLSRRASSSQASTQKRRNPLATLSSNDANTLHRHNSTTRLPGSRSISEASDVSLAACGTVQQRSKSASPSKHQETLEWKRRLVQGAVGYGDQTDLFGPSGLENIFAKSKGAENEAPTRKTRLNWLQRSSDIPMPSSPPPWPSNFNQEPETIQEDNTEPLNLEHEDGEGDDENRHGSFSSNPFALESLDDNDSDKRHRSNDNTPSRSSPDKAFIEPTQHEAAANRTVSGQTDLEQEDFSPVFVSKHHTVTGQVGYTALDSHLIKQFQSRTVSLRHPSQGYAGQSSDNSTAQQREGSDPSSLVDESEAQALPSEQDLSFSENLPTGSPFPNLGNNIELKRGGYSQYGSFKRRPLSPSQSAAETTNNPEASGLVSPIPSEGYQAHPSSASPKTPGRNAPPDVPKSRSSGSPLKLFGDHDTFTNNRLLRRMSQLNPDGTLRMPAQADKPDDHDRRAPSDGFFGSGELDDHSFNAEITITSASDSEKSDSDRTPGSDVPVPGSKNPQGFRFESSPQAVDTYKLKRRLSKHSGAGSKGSTLEAPQKVELHATVEDASESRIQIEVTVEQSRSYAEGKRPPTSPFKNPTPKRRRTLHATEIRDELASASVSYHHQLQEVVSSRKRKDARHGEAQDTADADILAQRKILRPRNPTPSQRRRQQIEAELREAAEEFAEQQPQKLEAVMEQIESSMASDAPQTLEQQAQAVASEVAAFTLRVRKPSEEHDEQGERKRSVTTQDFLNEAMMVMNLIRAKARPQSNLGSVEESDAEAFAQSLRIDGTPEEDALLRVSRPPSREGSGWRQPSKLKADARVISHLRRYEEVEVDDTDFIANSIASLQVDDEEQMNDAVIVVDESSNIRITGFPSDRGNEQTESDSHPNTQGSQGSTQDTHKSNGTSTGQTIGTSSTRKSDNVGTLAPDAVAHLIGDQVGGMTFDKDKQRWVRVSKSPAKSTGSFLELPSNVTSDDDPFREISDLPVDEVNEQRRISSPGKLGPDTKAGDTVSSNHDQAFERASHQQVVESRSTSNETVIPRPVTRDSSQPLHNYSSSVPSRYTAFASSQQQERVETRATSWSDEELARMSALGKARSQPLVYAAAQAELARRSVYGSIPEAPIAEATFPLPPRNPMPTDLATVDHIDETAVTEDEVEDEFSALRENTALDLADSDIEDIDSPKLRQTPPKPAFPPSSTFRTAPRRISLRRYTLTSGFTTQDVEQSELSFVAPLPGDRMMSVALSVSRPLSKRQQPQQVTELPSSPSKGGSSFMLSELPDFTVHEDDAERPSERALATRLAEHAAAEVNDRYALAVKELVKILTDVNEDEPYWEDLKQLDLRARSLASLHGLEDFCTHIQDMDVSNNALAHLHGAPASVRRLHARSNQLSSLSAWNHLVNLQYLDISNNQLEALDGLSCLFHLRQLRADDNNITELDGIFGLDGLLKLRLRRNKLRHVDFGNSQLQLLASLDLSENQITSVSNLGNLQSLTELLLDGNSLQHGLAVDEAMPRLTSLSVSDSNVEHLDASCFPNLQHLIADDNRLTNIDSVGKLKNLHTLSMRRQILPEGGAISLFDWPLEARTIYLSGNTIPSLTFSTSLLSVRNLELASVGLQELPDDFGLRMPNLRSLNLNFNSLKDVRPLLNIQKLEHLSICGNRLHRLRKSVATFAKMTTLRTLDIRDNPLTQGFHTNIASTISKHTSVVRRARGQIEENDDEQAAALEQSRYGYPSANVQEDDQHRARLDEDTRLRRRVYEMLLANSCRGLEELDGLKLDRTSAAAKDSVWERLLELGIIRRSQNGGCVLLG